MAESRELGENFKESLKIAFALREKLICLVHIVKKGQMLDMIWALVSKQRSDCVKYPRKNIYKLGTELNQFYRLRMSVMNQGRWEKRFKTRVHGCQGRKQELVCGQGLQGTQYQCHLEADLCLLWNAAIIERGWEV